MEGGEAAGYRALFLGWHPTMGVGRRTRFAARSMHRCAAFCSARDNRTAG
jgi:hypothetical protein